MRIRALAVGASVVTGAMLMLTGCGPQGGESVPVAGGSIDSLAEAAKKEGSLVLYSAEVQSDIDRITKAFTDEYGIPVEVVRLSTGELNQRFSGEADAGSVAADVLISTDPRMYSDNADWFAQIDDESVPGIADYPEESVTDTAYASLIYVYSIAYNNQTLSEAEAPTSWEDLLDEKYSGQLLMNDVRATPAYIAWLDALDKRFGDEYLEKLGEAGAELAPTASTGAQQLAAGEFAVNFPSQPHQTLTLAESGAPLGNNPIDDPSIAYANYLGVSADAPHPNAARLFAAWRLTDDGQDALCAGTYATPISGADQGCLDLPADWELVEFVDQERTDELLDLIGLS